MAVFSLQKQDDKKTLAKCLLVVFLQKSGSILENVHRPEPIRSQIFVFTLFIKPSPIMCAKKKVKRSDVNFYPLIITISHDTKLEILIDVSIRIFLFLISGFSENSGNRTAQCCIRGETKRFAELRMSRSQIPATLNNWLIH